MGALNPFLKESDLKMIADFYILKLNPKKEISPKDLPALIEMPMQVFLEHNFSTREKTRGLEKYIKKGKDLVLPENYTLMIPRGVKSFFQGIINRERQVRAQR